MAWWITLLLYSDLCPHVTSLDRFTLTILPQTYTHSFLHFLFSYLLYFSSQLLSLPGITYSYLFITNLLHWNVNSTRVGLGTTHCVSLVPKWCSSGSSVMFIEWVKPFWKSSLLVNFCDCITSGSRQTSKKANTVEWKGNWTGGEENQLHPRLHKPCHSKKKKPTLLELSFLITKWRALTRWLLKLPSHSKISLVLLFNLSYLRENNSPLFFSGYVLLWKKKNTIESCVFHKNCYLRRLYGVRKCHYKVK